MTTENVQEFISEIETNPTLRMELLAIDSDEERLSLAQRRGFDFTDGDIENYEKHIATRLRAVDGAPIGAAIFYPDNKHRDRRVRQIQGDTTNSLNRMVEMYEASRHLAEYNNERLKDIFEDFVKSRLEVKEIDVGGGFKYSLLVRAGEPTAQIAALITGVAVGYVYINVGINMIFIQALSGIAVTASTTGIVMTGVAIGAASAVVVLLLVNAIFESEKRRQYWQAMKEAHPTRYEVIHIRRKGEVIHSHNMMIDDAIKEYEDGHLTKEQLEDRVDRLLDRMVENLLEQTVEKTDKEIDDLDNLHGAWTKEDHKANSELDRVRELMRKEDDLLREEYGL